MLVSRYKILPCLLILSNFSWAQQSSLSIEASNTLKWQTQDGHVYQPQKSDDAGALWRDIGGVQLGNGAEGSYFVNRAIISEGSGPISYRVLETTSGTPSLLTTIANGSFEEGEAASADGWTVSSDANRSDAESNSGNYSMHVAIRNIGNTPSVASISQTISSGGGLISEGTRYDLSFWAKEIERGVSYVQQYQLEWLNSNGGTISSTGIQFFDTDESVWERVANDDLLAPTGAVDARVSFFFVTGAVTGALGEVFIDDVALVSTTAVGSTVALPVTVEKGVSLHWDTTLGETSQLFSSTDLQVWVAETGVLAGDGSDASLELDVSGRRKFFRVEYNEGETVTPIVTNIVPLHDATTIQEAEILVETDTALITHMGDRARDRHAREADFEAYDHYLSFYWEERTLALEIIDRVAKGGSDIEFNYTTQAPLGAPEFRAFFRGINTPAEYFTNLLATSLGNNQYTATLTHLQPENTPLKVGDRIELEISQFLEGATNGRDNYYGTTFLYIVGTGVVPWEGRGELLDSFPLPESGRLGGLTTLPYQYSNEPDNRFKQTAGNIAPVSIQPFMEGRRLHHTNFDDASHTEPGNPIFPEQVGKLGPNFIARSCVECHINNGRSLSPPIGESLLQGVVKVGQDEIGTPHPIFGSVLHPQTTDGSAAEGNIVISSYTTTNGTYADGASYELRKPNFTFSGTAPSHYSVRYSQQLVGLGLLEAIDESSILSLADPNDENNDGISGRPQIIIDPVTGEERLGRFTHKAGQARVVHQIAAALNTDMGITTTVFPVLDDNTTTNNPEISDAELVEMNRYISLLGVGARRDLDGTATLRGEMLFSSAGCAKCHTTTMTTGANHPMAELSNQTIHAYTDLLLHDMGSGLAANMGEGVATGAEWRTAPLWNIGLTAGVSGGEAYLHDGRARTLEEAILWHGGEGESAKEEFRTMSAADRDALISFLKSL